MVYLRNVTFYPVCHLLTGPPGLRRNGGIWKEIKNQIPLLPDPPRMMVQALHFASYNLSQGAWDDWFYPVDGTTRLAKELDIAFGRDRDVFVDSGGFQLLYSDHIDLSRWGLAVTPKHVLELQLKHKPQRIVSLDSPIPLRASREDARRLFKISLDNAVWLAEIVASMDRTTRPIPYLAIHGRTEEEIAKYVDRLEVRLGRRFLRDETFGLALGSQVPLTSNPSQIVRNALALSKWMSARCSETTILHVLGVGDSVISAIRRFSDEYRHLSFDNSTYVQNAMRLRIFDPSRHSYINFNPFDKFRCKCTGCRSLEAISPRLVADLLSRPAYHPIFIGDRRVNKSDVLAFIALHNLRWWQSRVISPSRVIRLDHAVLTSPHKEPRPTSKDYIFPLGSFVPTSPNLLLMPCTKTRPYAASRTHRRVLSRLERFGIEEGSDFDRITLSGLYGPVHWKHEEHPCIVSYDFPLNATIGQDHTGSLQARTGAVLNVIAKKYESCVALLPPGPYRTVFRPVCENFEVSVVLDIDGVEGTFR